MLEVGAGSGYAAAIIGQVAREVIGIERHAALARLAAERMELLGYANVRIIAGRRHPRLSRRSAVRRDRRSGQRQPCAARLLDQLTPGGRIVMPIGDPNSSQSLVKVTKRADGTLDEENLCAVRFVPLIGEHGFAGP